MKFLTKKIIWLFLGLLVGMIFSSNAFAVEDETQYLRPGEGQSDVPSSEATSRTSSSSKIRVYLTEGLGAGKEIYHIVKCEKIEAKAPLRCTQTNWNLAQYRKQCAVPDSAWDEDTAQRDRLPYNPFVLIQTCVKGQEDFGTNFTEKECKDQKEGVMKSKLASVWAAWVCPGNVTGCSSEDGIIRATLVADNEDAAVVGFSELSELQGKPYYIGQMYSIGKAEDKIACMEGHFTINSNGSVGLLDPVLGGDLSTRPIETCENKGISFLTKDPLITCKRTEVIEAEGGTDLLTKFIGILYKWATGLVGIIAVLVMVISGIQISTAGGDSAKVDSAKTRIMESIAGLAILFLAGLILYTINPGFFVTA